jgi:KDO2-lipid IV(A) lauroyltransferase
VRDFLLFWGWRIGSLLAQRVPLAVAYAVSALVGDIVYVVWRSRREIAKHNLAAVLRRDPEEHEVAHTARRSFREYSKYIVEIMRLPRLSDADLDELVEVEGAENFRRALQHGKGIIFVSAHFGNFEIGGVHIADEIAPLTVLADDIGLKRVFELLMGHRGKRDVHLVTEGMARAALAALRRNELVGMMMDLGPRAHAFDTVRVNFCGRETVFPAVAAQLSRVSGAPIVVGCVVRRAGRPFLGIAGEPIFVHRTKEALTDVRDATQRIVTDIERFVTSWPEQWYIYRPMWPGEPDALPTA